MKRAGLLKFRAKAQGVMEALWPGLVTIGGAIYEVSTAGVNGEKEQLVSGGMEVEVDFSFRILKSRFEDRPAKGSRVGFEGRFFRVEMVDGASDVAWGVRCVAEDD